MNIQAQLFKVFNTVKNQSAKWDKELEKEHEANGVTGMTGYYSAYYAGSKDTAKIMLKIYNGEFNDTEVGEILETLDNPRNEVSVN